MTHYHCEVILPPSTVNVGAAVQRLLAPFDEAIPHPKRAYEPFWDWYKIGGRWSGEHALSGLDPARITAFETMLAERKVSVSALQAGKPRLQPASQRAMVDQLWREWFPHSRIKQCPLVDAFEDDGFDVCRLSQVPTSLTCERLLIANDDGDPAFMLVRGFWNGVTYQETTWDGTLRHGLELALASHRNLSPPTDSILVTVDYHS